MRPLKVMLGVLPIIGMLASVSQAGPRPAGGASATAIFNAAWIGDGSERDNGPAKPGPTDPSGPAR